MFNRSLYGSITPWSILSGYNHPSVNSELSYKNHDFERLCVGLGVEPSMLHNVLELDNVITNSPAPLMDFDLVSDQVVDNAQLDPTSPIDLDNAPLLDDPNTPTFDFSPFD